MLLRAPVSPPAGLPGHVRSVLILGLPLVGGHLAQFVISLTDTLMMGWYGIPELAALTVASSLFFTLFLFGSGFSMALMSMVATFAARGEEVQIRRATRMAFWLSAAFFVCILPLMWFTGPLMHLAGQDPVVADLAGAYMRIALWGMVPALGVMVLKNYLAGLEHTRVVLWVTVAAAVANALGNYALIFGNWGAPEMGIAGAAWASVLSHLTALVFVVAYAVRVLPEHALFQRFWRPDWEMFHQVLRVGLPIGVTILAEAMLFLASAVLMGIVGVVPQAAHGIAMQLTSAAFMVHMGFSNAATVRAGSAVGRGDIVGLRTGAQAVMVLGAIWVGVATIAFIVFPEPLIGLFLSSDDPDRAAIISVGVGLLVMAALFQLTDAAQVLHVGLLRGLQDTRVPMIIAAVSYWLIGMPAAWVFGITLGWGGMGVWFGLVVGLAAAASALAWRFWWRAVPALAAGQGFDGTVAPMRARD